MLQAAIRAATGTDDQTEWAMRPWIRDVFDTSVVYEWGGKLWKADYSVAEDGAVTLASSIQVKVAYEPVATGADTAEAQRESEHLAEAAVDNTAWDGNAAMTAAMAADDPAAAMRAICAGRKSGPPAMRASWALPHHKSPGAAPNAAGVRNALSRLSQTQGLTNADAARKHLQAHLAAINAASESANPLDDEALWGIVGDRTFRENVVRALREHEAFRTEVASLVHKIEEGDLLEGEIVPLVEKAMRPDGTIPVKIIQPGWGSSGYYSPEVLRRDGPAVFPSGTQMFWNHPTAREESDRPEGDLRDLAGEFVSDPRYLDEGEAPAGPGLYADAKVLPPFSESIDELAPSIGLSIRGYGLSKPGEAEGRKGPIVTKLTAGRSVDFVTQAGAGGRILELFENARDRARLERPKEGNMADEKELQEATEALRAEREKTARLMEQAVLRQARDVATEVLAEVKSLPDITRTRLIESVSTNPPVTDSGELDTKAYTERIAQAIKAEADYLAKITGSGKVTGMGGTDGDPAAESGKPEEIQDRMEKGFAAIGLDESTAKLAAAGR